MMSPHMGAGARVGFNDTLTMGSWGQGARSALPMVGEVFQQAFRNKWIDQKAEFAIPRPKPRPPPVEVLPGPPPESDPQANPPGSGAGPVFDGVLEELRKIFR